MKILSILIILLFVITPLYALELDEDISDEDKETFDQILAPLMKIYNFIKYSSTVLAALFLLFAGITFVTSGNDRKKRDTAKDMATYVIIGLIVIWVSPIIVHYLTT